MRRFRDGKGFITRSRLSVTASVGLLWLAPGCGARWSGVPQGGQVAIHRDAGLVEEQADLIVSAVHAPVPFADAEDLLAFTVEITSRRQTPVEVTPGQFLLRNREGRLRRPLDPEQLLRALGCGSPAPATQTPGAAYEATGAAGGRVLLAAHRPRFWRSRYDRRYPYRVHYWYPYWSGYWPYGYPPYSAGYYSDRAYAEAERQRVARFVAEVWRAAAVGPEEIRAGHLIFRHDSEKGDEVTLLFQPPPPAAATATSPPAAEFAFRFVRTR